MKLRAVLPVGLLFLGGCLSVPSGIVDNFVPPQGQTVVTEIKVPLCVENTPSDKASNGSTTNAPTPCTTEVVTIAAAPGQTLVPNGFQRNRPRPPRIPRRR